MFIAVLPDHQLEPSPHYTLRENYLQALRFEGALPLVLPYEETLISEYLDVCGGLMLTGGGFTIDPRLFGQELRTPMALKPQRTEAELRFFKEAYARRMPILGICGGAQLINVALGGSLIQHLPTTHPHALTHSDPRVTQPIHPVHVRPRTLLSTIVEGIEIFGVNTSHLQAIDQLGTSLCVNAVAPDGIIEGIESLSHPFCLGVQWHPEYQVQPQDGLIFRHFVRYARLYAASHANHPE